MGNYHMEGYKQEFKPAHHEKWYWALLSSGKEFTEILFLKLKACTSTEWSARTVRNVENAAYEKTKRIRFKGEKTEGEMITYFQHVDGCCNAKGDLLFRLYRHSKSVFFHCYKKRNSGIQKSFPIAGILTGCLRNIQNSHLRRSLGPINRYLDQEWYSWSCLKIERNTLSHFEPLSHLYLYQLELLVQAHLWIKGIYETSESHDWEGSLKVTCSTSVPHHIQLGADMATELEEEQQKSVFFTGQELLSSLAIQKSCLPHGFSKTIPNPLLCVDTCLIILTCTEPLRSASPSPPWPPWWGKATPNLRDLLFALH